MAAKPWIFLSAAGCCAVASVVFPGSRHLYITFWTTFSDKSLADQVGIVASVVALFGVQISAAISAALFWRGREIEALRADVEAADKRRSAAEVRTKEEEAKVKKLTSEAKTIEESAPDRFLIKAMLSDSGPSTKHDVIPVLERGLLASAEPMAEACRLLIRKLLARDAEGDFQAIERAAKMAAALSPDDLADREFANLIVEHRAAEAMAKGNYDPSDDQFEPILVAGENDPARAEQLVDFLCDRAERAVRAGEYFVALRLAAKARVVSTLVQSPVPRLQASYMHAMASSRLGRNDEALREVDGIFKQETELWGADHPNVFVTRHLRAQVLSNLERYAEAMQEIDAFASIQKLVMGRDHYGVLATSFVRAEALSKLGQYEDTLEEIDAHAEHRKLAIGSDHGDTLATAYLRAKTLIMLRRHNDALDEIANFADRQAHALGGEHEGVFATRLLKAQALHCLGRHSEAVTEIDAFAECQVLALGDDHPLISSTSRLRQEALDSRDRGP